MDFVDHIVLHFVFDFVDSIVVDFVGRFVGNFVVQFMLLATGCGLEILLIPRRNRKLTNRYTTAITTAVLTSKLKESNFEVEGEYFVEAILKKNQKTKL